MNIYQKLQQARIKLQSMPLKKSGVNKFAGYKYFELADFLPTVQEIFDQIGVCPVVSFSSEYAELCLVNIEKPEEKILVSSPMAEANLKGTHPIQNLGAVETYQRRYLYMVALEIVEHDALDSSEPIKSSTITPVKAAMQSVAVNEEDMEFLRLLASQLVEMVEKDKDPAGALKHMEDQRLDSDQTLALWDIMAANSNTRNSIKKEKKARDMALKGMAA